MIQQQTWNCEHCGARGCVEMESAADVCTVIDLIRDDHRERSPKCQFGLQKVRVDAPREVK